MSTMLSTRDLSGLPDVDTLRRLLQSLAMLDAIISRGSEQTRCFSFSVNWSAGIQMGTFIPPLAADSPLLACFNASGCLVKGFVFESMMTPYHTANNRVWPGVLDEVPLEFRDCINNPAFQKEQTTFCIWRRYSDTFWQKGNIAYPPYSDPDGSEFLLECLAETPETNQELACWHFNKPFLTLDMVRHIYEFRPLTNELIRAMTPDVILKDDPDKLYLTLDDFEDDAIEIGYPIERDPKRDEEGKIIG